MAIKVALEHRTSYSFDSLVQVHPHVVRLRPAPHARTPIEAYTLTVEPANHFINWQQDAFGNFLARLVFPERTRELTITVGLVANMEVINPFDFFIEEYAENFGFSYPPELLADLEPYLRPVDDSGVGTGPGELVKAWVDNFVVAENTRTIDFLVQVNQAVLADVGYSVRMEPGVQSPDYTLHTAIGSCRDSAWLLVAILRQLGLAARFVSGYLVQLAADIPALDGPSGPSADFTDLHAWTEVFIPGAGWVGMDPTSGLFAGEGHIPLSATPHPSSAAPITGATGVCNSTLDFSNTVTRIYEDPRVTLPYTEQQWESVTNTGMMVDSLLDQLDVRLTMGGEPTFVSVDNQSDPQWLTEADGPHKRELASELAARLKPIVAPGGLIQRSQGKWYPGEPLPRWQIGLIWRVDGVPLWRDPTLFADPWAQNAIAKTKLKAAKRVADSLAALMGLPDSQVRPVFEDALAKLVKSIRQPFGEPPSSDHDLGPDQDSPQARKALVQSLDDSVTKPCAYLIPLSYSDEEERWQSANWRLKRGRIVLLEGDSPAGLRLPLDSISWRAAKPPIDPDPTASKLSLAEASSGIISAEVVDVEDNPTTALVLEVRGGILYVFLPPVEKLEHFIELVAVVEQVVAQHKVPVVLEGYGPPLDPRVQSLTVTPDPGVIEVNVQPTHSFAEQSKLLGTLYEQARLSRLGTESFDNDGTHGGTGGGNHITVGGITPADSPLLRRPDLLVSLLTYWQRHPALSYLFSGRFIGPTSQAPRVDEGRQESLYELEIAFAEIQRLSEESTKLTAESVLQSQPWLVDRALRHLLTDITGN
ncbi:MAG: transglutaminase family protein, partial [Mycobacteriaceae bacterium]